VSDTVVELEGVNGEWFNLTEGDRGVYLGTGVKGLYDPPVKVVYEEPGNYPGARYLNHRILRRDIVFGVEILNDKKTGDSWLSRDSEWRKAWAFDRDCKLYITTPESGTRYLKLRLGESIDVSMHTDPNGLTMNRAVMVCIAGDPFWYQDDAVWSAVTTEDTTFDPNPLPWPWPQEEIPSETIFLTVTPADGKGGLNPTDQAVFPKWSIPGSTEAPAEPYIPGLEWLGAPNSPATLWTIPDYSFEVEELANRRIRMPGLIGGLRTEEVQAVFVGGKPTGGTFTLTLNGQTTTGIAYNASNGAVKAALEALASVAFNDVSVTRAAATNETQLVTVSGGPTGGTFTLTFDGQTTAGIPFNASEGTLKNALIALSNVGSLDVSVTAQSVNETQVVQLVGEPTNGTFTLTFNGEETDPIPWDASAYTVKAALVKLASIGGGDFFHPADVSVTKPSGSYQPWRITFRGTYAGIDLQPLTADPSGLTGGVGIDIDISTDTEGSRVYACTFKGALSGFDFPAMTANAAGLTGGDDPEVNVVTSVDGSRPYLVTFTGNLSGEDVPEMTGSAAGLTGGTDMYLKVSTLREGVTAPAENVVIDTDPRVEQVSSESGSPIWSRMNGVRFRHYIPPWTESKTFEITVSGCVPGQMVTLRVPRPWSRPWGLE
jgi:hypothetical protein